MTSPAKERRDPGQEPVLAFLDNGARKRIDTHASVVFLEPDRVLKVKQAVRLPFLDFSTLDKRKHACEEEIAVNKRHAPMLYRRVVPITKGASGPEIAGSGEVIEWAVEMARFDEQQTFDHLAVRGAITAELGEALADVMLAAHKTAPASEGSTWPASIADIIDRNTAKFHAQRNLARDEVQRLHAASHRQMDAHLALMRRRAAASQVRRCHGDAHLGNIVLIAQKPVLFDAIEFDPDIATTDLLYDLAFPLMDLVRYAQDAAANRLFNRYLQETWAEQADALVLLPLFMSMRAAIRAHVLFTRHEQSESDAAIATQARSYFDLALRLISPAPPALVAIGGRSGTGKSLLARGLAPMLEPAPGALVLRSDVLRKALFGVDPLTALPAAGYAPDVTTRVYHLMAERAATALPQGISVVLDAAFLRQAERDPLPNLARASGARFRGIFLDADVSARLGRIAARGRDASDATREVALQQQSYDIGSLDWDIVDASGSPQDTLERATARLRT